MLNKHKWNETTTLRDVPGVWLTASGYTKPMYTFRILGSRRLECKRCGTMELSYIEEVKNENHEGI